MSAPLNNVTEFYNLPNGLIIQALRFNGYGSEILFSGKWDDGPEADLLEMAQDAFDELHGTRDLSEVDPEELGGYLVDMLEEDSPIGTIATYKITSPDGSVHSDINVEIFDLLWANLYNHRDLDVREKDGIRYRVGISRAENGSSGRRIISRAITLEWGNLNSDPKVIAIEGVNGADIVFVKTASTVTAYLVMRRTEFVRGISTIQDAPNSLSVVGLDENGEGSAKDAEQKKGRTMFSKIMSPLRPN
jgi:hypothetical protein